MKFIVGIVLLLVLLLLILLIKHLCLRLSFKKKESRPRSDGGV